MWDFEVVVEAAADGLRAERDRLEEEQGVLGIDALTELQVHPVLRAGLEAVGAVQAEVRYPSGGAKSRRSEGERCDIVLAPAGREVMVDAPAPLFGDRLVDPEDALWLEVKVVAQHVLYDGYARANRNYASELLQAVTADITKLSREERIVHAGVLLVLFAEDEAIAMHDLGAWHRRAVEKGRAVSVPVSVGIAIPDLIGNGWCAVALARVHRL